MKKIVFVQVGFSFDGSAYLPYAAGTIIANCQNDPALRAEYDFSDIIFLREPLADALKKTEGAYLVAFSCSVWNLEYNKALARRIKRRDPACVVVFGGHSVSLRGELPLVVFASASAALVRKPVNRIYQQSDQDADAQSQRIRSIHHFVPPFRSLSVL